MKRKKVCFVASSGGHFEQLMMLKPLMDKYDSVIVTEKTNYLPAHTDKKIRFVNQINRKEKFFIPKLLWLGLQSVFIYLEERPDVIITTGVLAVLPLCMLAKLFGKKVIYIESFAIVSIPSKSGRLMYHFADQFYVQWESLLKVYPNAIYKGGIY